VSIERPDEIWLPVPGYEGLYEISNFGRLRGSPRQGSDGRILNITPSKPCGYLRVRLYKKGKGFAKKIHRLVLEAFVGPCPPKHDGCHNNGKRDDCRLSNLRWDTRKANCQDAKLHGNAAIGERNGQSKLTRESVENIRNLRANGQTYKSLAKEFGVAVETVRSAAIGETWA
jgi:hypothetical protein